MKKPKRKKQYKSVPEMVRALSTKKFYKSYMNERKKVGHGHRYDRCIHGGYWINCSNDSLKYCACGKVKGEGRR